MDDETTEEVTVECTDCSTTVPQDEAEAIGDTLVCEECFESYGSCEDCDTPTLQDDLVLVHSRDTYRWTFVDKRVCDSCADRYVTCASCYERFSDTTTIESGSELCEDCRDNETSYCEDCDEWYWHDDASEHRHGACDCDVPHPEDFRVKDGDDWLQSDTRKEVEIPSGDISDHGMSLITRLLMDHGRNLAKSVDPNLTPYTDAWYAARDALAPLIDQWYDFAYSIHEVGSQWQGQRGNFTKRLSRHAHLKGLKIPAEVLTAIGNVAREQSTGSTVNLELTRRLNLSPEEFGHADSCWWQSYSEGRCALKSAGGIGMRTFRTMDSDRYSVTGRAWAMPLKSVVKEVRPEPQYVIKDGDYYGSMQPTEGPARLVATFVDTPDTESPDAWMIFNGYGALSGYAPARIMSMMAGKTYRKVGFEGEPMYVNAGGYIIADEDACKAVADAGGLVLDGLSAH